MLSCFDRQNLCQGHSSFLRLELRVPVGGDRSAVKGLQVSPSSVRYIENTRRMKYEVKANNDAIAQFKTIHNHSIMFYNEP